jgi:hypothetical protein
MEIGFVFHCGAPLSNPTDLSGTHTGIDHLSQPVLEVPRRSRGLGRL